MFKLFMCNCVYIYYMHISVSMIWLCLVNERQEARARSRCSVGLQVQYSNWVSAQQACLVTTQSTLRRTTITTSPATPTAMITRNPKWRKGRPRDEAIGATRRLPVTAVAGLNVGHPRVRSASTIITTTFWPPIKRQPSSRVVLLVVEKVFTTITTIISAWKGEGCVPEFKQVVSLDLQPLEAALELLVHALAVTRKPARCTDCDERKKFTQLLFTVLKYWTV